MHFLLRQLVNLTGIGYFNRPDPEIDIIYSEVGLDHIFDRKLKCGEFKPLQATANCSQAETSTPCTPRTRRNRRGGDICTAG